MLLRNDSKTTSAFEHQIPGENHEQEVTKSTENTKKPLSPCFLSSLFKMPLNHILKPPAYSCEPFPNSSLTTRALLLGPRIIVQLFDCLR